MASKPKTPAATLALILELPAGHRAAHVIYVGNADETDAKVARAAEVALTLSAKHGCSVRIDCTPAGSATATLDTVAA